MWVCGVWRAGLPAGQAEWVRSCAAGSRGAVHGGVLQAADGFLQPACSPQSDLTHPPDAHLTHLIAVSACSSDTQHSPGQVQHHACAPLGPASHAPTTLTFSSVCTACLYSGSAWARGEAGRGGSGPSTRLTGSSGAGCGALNMLMATSLWAMYCAPPSKPAAQQQAGASGPQGSCALAAAAAAVLYYC